MWKKGFVWGTLEKKMWVVGGSASILFVCLEMPIIVLVVHALRKKNHFFLNHEKKVFVSRKLTYLNKNPNTCFFFPFFVLFRVKKKCWHLSQNPLYNKKCVNCFVVLIIRLFRHRTLPSVDQLTRSFLNLIENKTQKIVNNLWLLP